jgi:hypothetical protein
MFFFEKKNQKTFATLARSSPQLRAKVTKVFCFFFFKKEVLSSTSAPHAFRLLG